MPITLKIIKKPDTYLETEIITPDNFANKKLEEIKNLPIYLGNRKMKISDFFEVYDDIGKTVSETTINIEGDLSRVQRIGEKMSAGEIIINGNVGMHLGNSMKGGKITVKGNADDWVGAMMEGGEIVIEGNAGNHCGSAYRGNWIGMTNGKIFVKGKVGVESGAWMRSSKTYNQYPILKCGSADLYLGVHNHGGTIICEGDCEGRTGADMASGQIIIKGKIKQMLPSFKKVEKIKEVQTPIGTIKGDFIKYIGDFSISPKPTGELYILEN